jgi:putative acetyltransferase
MLIKIDDLRGPEIAALLQEHLADMRAWSPPESVHALDLDKLRSPDITFWTVWDGNTLLGCGALKALEATQGEIKSMRTAAAHRGKGVAAVMLAHIVQTAEQRSYTRLSLETGSQDQFAPARALYSGFGFTECAAFGDYQPDAYSTFMTRSL